MRSIQAACARGPMQRSISCAGVVALTIVVLSWRRPWIGGVTFVLLGVAHALAVSVRLDWIAAISGPLMVLAGLYLWAWRRLQVNAD